MVSSKEENWISEFITQDWASHLYDVNLQRMENITFELDNICPELHEHRLNEEMVNKLNRMQVALSVAKAIISGELSVSHNSLLGKSERLIQK